MKFSFKEVDADLSVREFLLSVVAGIAVVGFPLFIKGLLLFVGI